MEFVFDNRIIKALSKITGESERQLDNVFVFCHENKAPLYFATDGHIAMVIEEKEPEFTITEEKAIQIPDYLAKFLTFDKKEQNSAMNKTRVIIEEGKKAVFATFRDKPIDISFYLDNSHFEKMPEGVFDCDMIEQRAVCFNPSLANKISSALSILGMKSAPTFGLSDMKLSGTKENEEFSVKFTLMRCRSDD